MKKELARNRKKLMLHRETLRRLDARDLGQVQGGTYSFEYNCETEEKGCEQLQEPPPSP